MGVSGYPRWAEESPLRQLPAGPAGDNRVFDFGVARPLAEFLNKLAEWYLVKWQCVSELRKSIPAKSHEKTWELARLFVMNNGCNYLIIS